MCTVKSKKLTTYSLICTIFAKKYKFPFHFPVFHACGCLPKFVEMVCRQRTPYME